MTEPFKLEPCDIREVWDKIKPGLEEIKAEWPVQNTWRVEDVYAAVIAEQAVLYDTEDGFAICNLRVDQYSGATDLLIWIAYAYDNKRGGILKKYLPSFIEVAKHLGCGRVVTLSRHPALAKVLEPVYTMYGVNV
jgi:hypothetical protein